MTKNISGLLFSLLMLSLVSFASFGGGGSPSPPKSTPDLFFTGACSNQPVSMGVSVAGSPLSGASVEITQLTPGSSPVTVASGTTDSSGVFTFTPSQASDYDAVVTGNTITSTGRIFTITDCTPKVDIEHPNNSSGINFQCTDFATMAERVTCRINLPEDQAKNNLLFLPEECRALKGTERDNCINSYTVIQRCRHLSTDANRDACYFTQVSDLSNVKSLRTACAGNSSCIDDLRAKVYAYVKFRIYNLEEKAERLWGKGLLTQNETVDFIVKIETKKQLFNNATSVADKESVLMQMQQDWNDLRGIALIRTFG